MGHGESDDQNNCNIFAHGKYPCLKYRLVNCPKKKNDNTKYIVLCQKRSLFKFLQESFSILFFTGKSKN